jgi:protein-disulfide isomerase
MRSQTKRLTAGLALVAPLLGILVACGGDAGDSSPQKKRSAPPASPTQVAIRDSIKARAHAGLAKRPDTLGMRADSARVLGAPTANLFLVVTSDFQCHECRDLALNVLPEVRREFVDNGRIRLAFINDPQERFFNARFAGLAALCAGLAGRFWQMHDQLFINQASWERLPDPRDFMHSLAVTAGVPANVYNDCMSRNRMLPQLTADIVRSRETGVNDVPTVFLGDRRLEQKELTVEGIRKAVLRALGDH